jgi:hypothetical protein
VQIQPDLITLSDEYVGTLAPQVSVLPEDDDADGSVKIKNGVVSSFSTLSRIDRLKATGRADTTEMDVDDKEEVEDGSSDDEIAGKDVGDEVEKDSNRKTKEKMKQRGKSKSLKRYVPIEKNFHAHQCGGFGFHHFCSTGRHQKAYDDLDLL